VNKVDKNRQNRQGRTSEQHKTRVK
jgi:hypothetical protein